MPKRQNPNSSVKFDGTIPPELIQAIKSNRCILFVGAGLSAKVQRSNKKNLPLWGGFLEELVAWAKSKNTMFWNGAEEIENIINKGNYLLAAQELQESLSVAEFAEFLNSVFRDKKVIPSDTHKNIFKIPFRAILTTNYDTLIEGAYALTHEGQVPVKFTQEDLRTISSPLRGEDFFVFKIHGDIDRPDSIVLGSRSYNQLLFRTPEYLHFLETLFTTHTVLFVGFSGSDNDLDLVIDRLSTIYSRTLNKHYILLPSSKFNLTEKRRLLIDRRLEVIEYESDDTHSQVDYFFDSLDEIVHPDKDEIPKSKRENEEHSKFLIISSKDFRDRHEKVVMNTVHSNQKADSISWFWGLDLETSVSRLNKLIEEADNVIVFFDKSILRMKETESLLELLALREVDKKVRITPIAIGADISLSTETFELSRFLLRRMIFIEELTEQSLIEVLNFITR